MTPQRDNAPSLAEWRGRITEKTNDHTRRLNDHDVELDGVHRDIGELREGLAAHRAKVAVVAGIGSVLGSGVAGTLLLLLAGHH